MARRRRLLHAACITPVASAAEPLRDDPDTRIPTESELVDEFEVARTTARRAVSVLREEGLIYTVPTRGSYVSRKAF